jgi:hypothetical protein
MGTVFEIKRNLAAINGHYYLGHMAINGVALRQFAINAKSILEVYVFGTVSNIIL